MEDWRTIVGFEDYAVSNLGRVMRTTSRTNGIAGRVLRMIKHDNGRLYVSLSKNGVKKVCIAHRLVARAFLGPCPPGHQVNHKDGNPLNNHCSNLEYVTPEHNVEHSLANKLQKTWPKGERAGGSKLKERQVLWMRTEYAAGRVTQPVLSKLLGISSGQVSRIITRQQWAHI